MSRSFYEKSLLENIPEHSKVFVIGGGIAGAGVFRDLSLHNIPCVLVDKNDFTSQTSQSSSKMLHGGIRYLENLDFALVWEALHEKNLWLKLTPHLAYPEQFYLPVYKESLRPLWMVRIGLWLYDALSSFHNIPSESASPKETLQKFPFLKSLGLSGAGVYSDAVMDDSKLTLECIYDGMVSPRSYACNHTSLQGALKTEQGYQLHLKDEINGAERVVSCDYLIFTTGPFTDNLLTKLNLFPWKPKLALSRGSHLWIDNQMLQAKGPMVLTPNDGRVIFVIPQRDKTLVGTTEVPGSADFNQSPSQDEEDYLLKNLKDFFPTADIDAKYILGRFAGVRPLVMENPDANLGKVARNHRVYQPQENSFVLLGGKYTTFRVMARDVVEPLLHKMKLSYRPELSLSPLRRKSHILPWKDFDFSKETFENIMRDEFPKTMEDFMYRRVGQTFSQNKELEHIVSQFLKDSPWPLKS